VSGRRRGNRRTEGFVLETLCEAADKPLKPVFTVLDEQPLLDTSLLRLAKWMKARYFCTVYDALKTILPAGIWFRYRETYRLADGVQESDLSALAAANRTDKLLLEAITARGELERSELEELGGARTMKRLKLLCEQGVLYSETTAIRQISDKSVRMVSLAVSAEDALAAVEPKRRSAPLRYAAVEMLCAQGTLSSSDICYYTGASLQTLRGLEKAGIVSFAKQEVLRVSRHEPVEMALPIVLNDEQQQAFDGLLPLIARREAGAALLLILGALLHAQRRRNRLEKEMVERARTTDLYRALYPVLRTANRCCVDRVLIRRDEVRIVLFKPMNSVYRFVFEERGFDRVNDPKVLKALALAISADMDHLRDNRCYSFSVRQDITAQGDKVYWYEYNILPYYKDTLTKAWYHQPEVEDGIIR